VSFFSKNKNYILDGGSGQTLLEKGLVPKGTLWSATALIDENLHNLVLDMHKDFINAGSDLIVTSNFSVRKKRFNEHNISNLFDYATKSAGILAKKSADLTNRKIIVAGSLPTQGFVYSARELNDENEIYEGFSKTSQILNPYVDLFYLDVLTSIKEIKISCKAIQKFNKPVLIGIHLNKEGNLPSSEEIEEVFDEIKNLNCCGIIAACVSPEIVELAQKKFKKYNLPYGFKVNAFKNITQDLSFDSNYTGNPVESFGTRADEFTPEVFKNFVKKISDTGSNLLGGCCEIKPKHIAKLKGLV